MPTLDSMLARYIHDSLRENLGKKQVKEIEEELYSWYKIDLEESMMQFDALDRVLVNMYGKRGALALEKQFVLPVIETSTGTNSKNMVTFSLNDADLTDEMFAVIKDDSSMKIINMLKEKPMTAQQIMIHKSLKDDYSEKTIYRKIGELSDIGCIGISGHTKSDDNRRVRIYESVFDAIDLRIEGNTMAIRITVREKTVRKSLILSTVFS